MFGNITDLPQIHSYEEALGHYAQIKPIRGSNNLRPICKTKNGRRKKHMEIVRRDDAVACRLYDTDVLTFFKDGTIEYNSGTWITNSTHSFASAILYPHVGFWTKQGHTEVSINWQHHEDHAKSYHISPNQTIKMKCEGDSWVAIDPPKHFEYYLKRKEYNDKRKPLKEFQDHCIRMAKLADPTEQQADNHFTQERGANDWWYYLDMYKDLTLHYHKDLVDGSNSWERLVPMLLETARVRRGNWVWETQTHEVTSYFDTQRIKDFISDVVKYAFADELFEERETSRRTFNKNAKYIWHKYKGDTD